MAGKNSQIFILMFALMVTISACATIDVFERNVAIPDQQWQSSFKPEISFDIDDTTSLYNIFVVIRHTDAYRYNNIWMNVYTQVPGDTINKQRLDLRLATDDKGWLGSGMDDIFEQRIQITKSPQQLSKKGKYVFRLENIMRDEPLQHVMNVGIRVEKSRS
jgi:gliding motility-associated lipoprotein GldH